MFMGEIRRGRVFHRALSSWEIKHLYQYEKWYFMPWWKRILLLPCHLYPRLKVRRIIENEWDKS